MKLIKKYYILVFILFILIIIVSYRSSYAFFNDTKEEHGKLNVVVGNLKYKLESDSLNDGKIIVEANTSKEIKVKITSLNDVSSKYELYYVLDKFNDNLIIGKSSDSDNDAKGIIDANNSKMINIIIRNESDISSTITFKVIGGLVDSDLVLAEGSSLTNLCNYDVGYVWNFDYTGGEQEFTVPCSGQYKLETWGAQGGSYSATYYGGYGSYSTGIMKLNTDTNLYIDIGGQGVDLIGGYNGGGTVNDGNYGKAGGGATHISTTSGLLSTLSNQKDSILIVAGGGGGAAQRGGQYGNGNGGSAGGYIGSNGESVEHSNGYGYAYGSGGTQDSGGHIVWFSSMQLESDKVSYTYGYFGKGGGYYGNSTYAAAGGGSGFYGGGSSMHGGAGGGSGYIGNSLLTDKTMYCYNCSESTEEVTKTISATCVSDTPTSNCSKQGNGYTRITYLGN